MNYVLEAQYNSFLMENMYHDMMLNRYINECIVLKENSDTINKIMVLNEELNNGIEMFFKKFTAFIRTILDKFIANMEAVTKENSEFLNKYKDVILTKKVDKYPIEDMPNYSRGIEKIKSTKTPVFDMNSMKDLTDVEIQKKIIPEFKDGEFKDFCMKYFTSAGEEPRTVQSDQLSMKDMFEFCMNFDNITNTIKADSTNLQNAAKQAENTVVQSLNKMNVKKEGFEYDQTYSMVYESFIMEAEDEKAAGPKIVEPEKKSEDKSDGKDNLNLKVDKSEDKDNKPAETKSTGADEDAKKIQECTKLYLNTVSVVFGSKLNAVTQIYKQYMKIIKYHVRKAVGTKDKVEQLSDSEKTEVRALLDQYNEAKDDNDRKTSAQKIIQFYKDKMEMEINETDVAKIASKNKKAVKEFFEYTNKIS